MVVKGSKRLRDGFASPDRAARLSWGSGRSSAQPRELQTSWGRGFVVAINSSAHQRHKTRRYGKNAFSQNRRTSPGFQQHLRLRRNHEKGRKWEKVRETKPCLSPGPALLCSP